MAIFFNFHSGIGKPISDNTDGDFITFCKGVCIAAWIYPALPASIRISILPFDNRIFPKADTKYMMLIWLLTTLQVIYFEIVVGFFLSSSNDRSMESSEAIYILLDVVY